MPLNRPDKTNYYLDIAQTVAQRSTCLRRAFGAIIVKNDIIISTGYNGAPRDHLGIPRGERYEMCRSVHAEANAIIAASREQMLGATLYMACIDVKSGELMPGTCSCMMCKRQVINAGIAEVIVRENEKEYTVYKVEDWVENDDSLTGKFGY